MNQNHRLKQLIDSIKKTDEVIAINKASGAMAVIIEQYEGIKQGRYLN
jgi:hypothetical protein